MLSKAELNHIKELVVETSNDLLKIEDSIKLINARLNNICRIINNDGYVLTYEKYHEIVDPINELGSMT